MSVCGLYILIAQALFDNNDYKAYINENNIYNNSLP